MENMYKARCDVFKKNRSGKYEKVNEMIAEDSQQSEYIYHSLAVQLLAHYVHKTPRITRIVDEVIYDKNEHRCISVYCNNGYMERYDVEM